MEYLAFRQGRPVFLSSELRISIGHGGLDHFLGLPNEGRESGLSDGQIDRLFAALSLLPNGPQLAFSGLNLPEWSHFSQGIDSVIFYMILG